MRWIEEFITFILCLAFFLMFLFLSIFPVYADDPPRLMTYPPNKVMGFLGLDTDSSAPLLADGRAINLNNVKLSTRFSLKKRDGYSVINDTLDDLNTSSPSINGIFDATYSDGNNYAYAFVGSALKYDNSGTWTNIIPYYSSFITAGQNNQFICTMALDLAVCTNDVDKPLSINKDRVADQLGFGSLTNPPTKAKAVAWFRNFLVLGNTVENAVERPTRFRWSNIGTTGTWTAADFNDISELGGDEIIAFKELYGNLYVFLKRAIWKVTFIGGDDVFSFNKVIDGIGAISQHSVQLVRLPNNQEAIIFLNENKRVFLFNGITIQDIGARVQPTLNNLNENRLQYAVAAYDEEAYYLSATTSGESTNDVVLVYQVEIGEWSRYLQVDANAFGRIKTSDLVKTYFGNYNGFVYWLDNPDLNNDVDGATGVVDSVAAANVDTETGAIVVIDSELTSGNYTGATIRITSGTGVGQEAVIVSQIGTSVTGVVVSAAFSTQPDSTSNYSIGAIEADYQTKWYDMGQSSRKKNFRGLYFWAAEESNNETVVKYAHDFGTAIGSVTESLAPPGSSVWDTAVWDEGIWGTTGDKFHTIRLTGVGRYISFTFENRDIDEDFEIYGYHMLADGLDIR